MPTRNNIRQQRATKRVMLVKDSSLLVVKMKKKRRKASMTKPMMRRIIRSLDKMLGLSARSLLKDSRELMKRKFWMPTHMGRKDITFLNIKLTIHLLRRYVILLRSRKYLMAWISTYIWSPRPVSRNENYPVLIVQFIIGSWELALIWLHYLTWLSSHIKILFAVIFEKRHTF